MTVFGEFFKNLSSAENHALRDKAHAAADKLEEAVERVQAAKPCVLEDIHDVLVFSAGEPKDKNPSHS